METPFTEEKLMGFKLLTGWRTASKQNAGLFNQIEAVGQIIQNGVIGDEI